MRLRVGEKERSGLAKREKGASLNSLSFASSDSSVLYRPEKHTLRIDYTMLNARIVHVENYVSPTISSSSYLFHATPNPFSFLKELVKKSLTNFAPALVIDSSNYHNSSSHPTVFHVLLDGLNDGCVKYIDGLP